MTPAIFSLGQGIPNFPFKQTEIAQQLIQNLNLNDHEAWIVNKIYNNSKIDTRYSVLPYLLFHDFEKPEIGMKARTTIYQKEAPLLAEKSARSALKNWNRGIDEITHIISVSCTGAVTPGLEFTLTHKLGLNPYTSRIALNFMGCFGAFKGLSIAHKIACENPENRVLVVCTELCTLHFHSKHDLKSTIIQSLFGDGASAAIVGTHPRQGEVPLFEILAEKSYALQNTENDLTWNAGDCGFDMTLSSGVPGVIEKNILDFVQLLIGENKSLRDLEWAVHPGGKAILEAVQKGLNLENHHNCSAWKILSHYGNLSSATLFYILNDILIRGPCGEWSVGLGFGPGLSIEGILFKNLTKTQSKNSHGYVFSTLI